MNFKTPFNIDLLSLDERIIKLYQLKPIVALDVFESATQNYHPQGLYSVEIFGQEGTEQRFTQYSYISTIAPLIHPLIFKLITKMKSFYGDIMSSKAYAIWDDKTKQFVPSTQEVGKTGYHFFLSHLNELQFEDTGSQERLDSVVLYKKKAAEGLLLTKNIIVIPAAYRDVIIEENGNYSSDEINDIYRRLIAASNTITEQAYKLSPVSFDAQTMSLQRAYNDLYEYLVAIISGKNGFMLAKFVSRILMYGTRNVITAMPVSSTDLDDIDAPNVNETSVGLYQFCMAIRPLARSLMKQKVLGTKFEDVSSSCLVTNKKTLMSNRVHLSARDFDRFSSTEGLDGIMSYLERDENRDKYVSVDKDHYLCLIYNDGTYVKVLSGLDELPEGFSKEYCTPITYAELMYYSVGVESKKIPFYVTRYPITGAGSIYPSIARLETTSQSKKLIMLDDNWQATEVVYPRFMIKGTSYFNSMSAHPSRLGGLGADHDGDQCNGNALMTDEAIHEVFNEMSKISFYLDTSGNFANSFDTDTIKYVMHNLGRTE